MENRSRYTMDYTSGATGYGWSEDTNSLAEVKRCIKHFAEYTMYFSVWDNKTHDFIYLKRVLTYKPEINKIAE